MKRRERPPRIAVIGIDGSGKSSTTLRAIELLRAELDLCKAGRGAFALKQGACTYYQPRVSRFFERCFRVADQSRRPGLIGLTRFFFVLYQGWVEPRMVRRFRPDCILNTRCMVIDPAIYTRVYHPGTAGRLRLRWRLRIALGLSRLPVHDLYILLRTPAGAAMERIHRRIARTPEYASEPREYWLHLHEQEATLERIGSDFDAALAEAGDFGRFEVLDIDTTRHSEEEVAERIAGAVRRLVRGERGSTTAAEVENPTGVPQRP